LEVEDDGDEQFGTMVMQDEDADADASPDGDGDANADGDGEPDADDQYGKMVVPAEGGDDDDNYGTMLFSSDNKPDEETEDEEYGMAEDQQKNSDKYDKPLPHLPTKSISKKEPPKKPLPQQPDGVVSIFASNNLLGQSVQVPASKDKNQLIEMWHDLKMQKHKDIQALEAWYAEQIKSLEKKINSM